MSDIEREAFETWYENEFKRKPSEAGYETFITWSAWQAARAQGGQGAEPVFYIDRLGFVQRYPPYTCLPEGTKLYTQPQPAQQGSVPDEVIKAAVDRFLQWKLPADFYPDGGVSFDRAYEYDSPHWPVGTNILTYEQAERMLRECLGATTPQPPVEQEGE